MTALGRLRAIFSGDLTRYTPEEEKIFAATRNIGTVILLAVLAGVAALLLWACGLSGTPNANGTLSFSAILGANLLVGMAAGSAGAVFGFIFGIPRTSSAPVTQVTTVTPGSSPRPVRTTLTVNTNLERISDWLTTLLIGATLVQIKDIAAWIGGLGKNLLRTGAIANDAVVPIIVIMFFSLAFLGVYLITRLYVTSAFGNVGSGLEESSTEAPSGAVDDRSKATSDLNTKLMDALKTNTSDALKAARQEFDDAKPEDVDRGDPALNANVARILMRLLNGQAPPERAKAEADLNAAIDNVKKSQVEAAALKNDIASGTFKTGDSKLDNDLKGKL